MKGKCGAVKREETVSCRRVSLSLNKTGRQPGGRQPTKEEVANEDQRKDALDKKHKCWYHVCAWGGVSL